MSKSLKVYPAQQSLVGRVRVPGDKSIAHRALMLASLATGVSEIRSDLPALGEDIARTATALRALGVDISWQRGVWRVQGVGLFGLRMPDAPLHVGESGTTARLLSGLLAAQEFSCGMHASPSMHRRPMQRVLTPLRERGARIHGEGFPLRFSGLQEGQSLAALHHAPDVASAQVKGALLLSGLFAKGVTVVSESTLTRDHTERMMHALQVPIETSGQNVLLNPAGWSGVLPEFSMRLPGDASSAFALIAAAVMLPGSQIEVAGVSLNPTRLGGFAALRAAGVHAHVETHGDSLGEPFGDVGVMAPAGYTGFELSGELLVRSIDEVPVLLCLAACARGETRLDGAAELRLKESDRLLEMTRVLRAFGVSVQARLDGLVVQGQDTPLQSAEVDAAGDHRIAMAAVLLALRADGPSLVHGSEALGKSFAGFVSTLRSLGAKVENA